MVITYTTVFEEGRGKRFANTFTGLVPANINFKKKKVHAVVLLQFFNLSVQFNGTLFIPQDVVLFRRVREWKRN